MTGDHARGRPAWNNSRMGDSPVPESVFEIAGRHIAACERFGLAVDAAQGRWSAPSPCTEWDARGVVEHVIGFHDVLLLRPMGAKPQRPHGDPAARWNVTRDALRSLLDMPGLFDGPVEVPAVGNNPPTRIEAAPLVGLLSLDVLIHSWDLARAVGGDDRLDPDLCELFLSRLPDDPTSQVTSGMFAPPVTLPETPDAQSALLARLGRDPGWRPPGADQPRARR
jgi:uncharacterized protein (TIGR03086 family)